MNRLPAPLTTNCDGIIRSLSMNCSRPSGQHIAGNHQASSSRSVAAPTFSPARIPSPVAAGLPKLQSFSSTGQMFTAPRHVVVEAAAGQDDAAAGADALRAAVAFDDGAGHRPPSTSVINSVIGASSHSGMPWSFIASRIRAVSD